MPCGGPRCGAEHAEALKAELKSQLPDRKVRGIRISTTSCQGMCLHGPNLIVYPEGVVYHQVQTHEITRIVEEHLKEGKVLEDLESRLAPPLESGGDKSGPSEPN